MVIGAKLAGIRDLLSKAGISLRDTPLYCDEELISVTGVGPAAVKMVREEYPTLCPDMSIVVSGIVSKSGVREKVLETFPDLDSAREYIRVNHLGGKVSLCHLVPVSDKR